MSDWVRDKMDARHETIWEHLDTLAAAGVTEFPVHGLWRSLPHYGPAEYNDCQRVLRTALDVGLMVRLANGRYVLVGATEAVPIPQCVHHKTGPHPVAPTRHRRSHYCAGPVRIGVS